MCSGSITLSACAKLFPVEMIYRFNDICLDTQLYQIKNGEHPVPVEPQVFDLVVYLVQNHRRVVPRGELLAELWPGKVVSDAALNGCLKAARKAVGDNGRAQRIIKTVHGRGYQFVASLSEGSTDSETTPTAAIDISTSGELRKPSILVLPFSGRSSDPGDKYFAQGITDEVRMCLSRFKQILVIARESSMELESMDALSAASRLGVDYVLDGSVQRSGELVRISTRLMKGISGEQLWAEQYERQYKDIFQLQDDIANKITSTLAGRIESDARDQAMLKAPSDLNAYDFLLRGNYYFDDWGGTQDNMPKAEEMYRKALELVPDFAAAYTGLACVYTHLLDHGWTDTPQATGEAAIEFALKAIALDERDSSARLALAYCYYLVRSDFDRSVAQFRVAIDLNPNDYNIYCIASWVCLCSGNLDEGISCGTKAFQRNPLLPDNCLLALGFGEYLAERYEKAVAAFNRMSDVVPEAEACIAACYAQLGETEKADAAATAFLKNVDQTPVRETDWREFWLEKLGELRNDEPLDHLLDGVRKAGLLD